MREIQRISQAQERFTDYYEKWLLQLDAMLHQLLTVPRDSSHEQQHKILISKFTDLYKDYYMVKWAGAHEDVLGFFSPTWLSPLENAHLWITGFKPSIFYKLALRYCLLRDDRNDNNNGGGRGEELMVMEMKKKIEEMRWRTSLEEEKVEREMERQQVSVADRRMVELARMANNIDNNNIGVLIGNNNNSNNNEYCYNHRIMDDQKGVINNVGFVDVALSNVLPGLERVMKAADCVRLKALKGLLEVLSPLQCVDFMTAVLTLQLRMRNWGKRYSRSS